MKRTLLSRRNALLSRTGPRLGLIALVLVVLVVLLRVILPGAFLAAAAPFLRLSGSLSASTNSFFAGFDNASKLASERDVLAASNATLGEENAVLAAKVADLEGLLGTSEAPLPGIIAGVLARPPQTAYDTLVVGAGSSVGVVKGDVAYAASGIPVGTVAAVGANSSRITLLSAPQEVTPGWVGEARLPISLLGVGGGGFVARVPHAASTTVGDLVYVSGPGSVPIGTVRASGGEPSAPFVTLAISASVNIFSLPQVLIRHAGPATWPLAAPTATTTLSGQTGL